MNKHFLLPLIILALSVSLWPQQKVEIKPKEDRPLDLGVSDGQTRGLSPARATVKPDRFTVRYIQVTPGPNGTIQNASSSQAAPPQLISDYNFPSLDIILSVAAKVVPDASISDAGQIDGKVRTPTELIQMCLNVRLSGLNANKLALSQPLAERDARLREFGEEPLLTMGIAPYESSYTTSESQESKISGATENMMLKTTSLQGAPLVGTIASYFNPFGMLASGLAAIFKVFSPTKNLPNQISYHSAPNEFGWIWRQQSGYGIEGIHHCMALLRTHRSIKYILAEAELITDWKRFGAWVQGVDFLIPVISDQK